MNAPKCDACRLQLGKLYRAVGQYGWSNETGELIKAELCSDHASMLRQKAKVVVLASYRKKLKGKET